MSFEYNSSRRRNSKNKLSKNDSINLKRTCSHLSSKIELQNGMCFNLQNGIKDGKVHFTDHFLNYLLQKIEEPKSIYKLCNCNSRVNEKFSHENILFSTTRQRRNQKYEKRLSNHLHLSTSTGSIIVYF